MNRDMLIQYVNILNKMEDTDYDIQMSRNGLDSFIIQYWKEKAANDEEIDALLTKLKSLEPSERMVFVKDYLNSREKEVPKEDDSLEEIASVFGIDVRDIQHIFLANGGEVFSFYSHYLSRNVVLENPKAGRSLVEQLHSIQEENEQYQGDDSVENVHDILTDKALETDLELIFYSKEEVMNHMDAMGDLTADGKKQLEYLLQHYDEYMIQGINLENMIYVDQSGAIQETIIDDKNQVHVSTPVNTRYVNQTEENVEDTSSYDEELQEMFHDDEEFEDEKGDSLKKQKMYVKRDASFEQRGFTNNAFYFFLIFLAVLFVIAIILCITML